MNIIKFIYFLLMFIGALIISSWMIVDIYSTEKLNIDFVVIGFVSMAWGSLELNHIQLMEKLNESI